MVDASQDEREKGERLNLLDDKAASQGVEK
jgi:hypothetical protein